VNNQVVGFMSLDSNIDYLTMLESYQIDAYDSLYIGIHTFQSLLYIHVNRILDGPKNQAPTSDKPPPSKPKPSYAPVIKNSEDQVNQSMDGRDIGSSRDQSLQGSRPMTPYSRASRPPTAGNVAPAVTDNNQPTPAVLTANPTDIEKKENSEAPQDKEKEPETLEYPIEPFDNQEHIERKNLASRMKRVANAFCISMFCINEDYADYSNLFIKVMFYDTYFSISNLSY
jgi:hypothetical protein